MDDPSSPVAVKATAASSTTGSAPTTTTVPTTTTAPTTTTVPNTTTTTTATTAIPPSTSTAAIMLARMSQHHPDAYIITYRIYLDCRGLRFNFFRFPPLYIGRKETRFNGQDTSLVSDGRQVVSSPRTETIARFLESIQRNHQVGLKAADMNPYFVYASSALRQEGVEIPLNEYLSTVFIHGGSSMTVATEGHSKTFTANVEVSFRYNDTTAYGKLAKVYSALCLIVLSFVLYKFQYLWFGAMTAIVCVCISSIGWSLM